MADQTDPRLTNHSTSAQDLARVDAEVNQNLRWNMTVHLLDGALFWFGINFAAGTTIVPLYVRRLTESRLFIGLAASVVNSGWYIPQLLTVNYIERQPLKKPIVINFGFFAERLPLLGMAASAFLLAARSPAAALALFLLSLTWFNVGAGLIAVAWQDMFAKVIPVQFRGRLLGTANAAGTAAGVLGASFAATILKRHRFPTNFGLCFTLAFVFIFLSWLFLAQTREPSLQTQARAGASGKQFWHLLSLLRSDRNFAVYLAARVVTMLGRMGIGFLTVYALERWALSDSQAGLFTTALVIGQALANLALGATADRFGHKLVLEISLALTACAMLGAILIASPSWMYLVFLAVGAAAAGDVLSMIGIVMEFSGPDQRPTYTGLANTVPGLFAAIAPLIGGWISGRVSYSTTFALGALFSMVAWVILHTLVREPRGLNHG